MVSTSLNVDIRHVIHTILCTKLVKIGPQGYTKYGKWQLTLESAVKFPIARNNDYPCVHGCKLEELWHRAIVRAAFDRNRKTMTKTVVKEMQGKGCLARCELLYRGADEVRFGFQRIFSS